MGKQTSRKCSDLKLWIKIKVNLQFICLSHEQIQEKHSSGFSTVFNECGKTEKNVTSSEYRLLITFVSNNDTFTAKGFELKLKGNYNFFKAIKHTLQNNKQF